MSVGVPVLNGERHLPAALYSILNQDYQNIEVIVSDNASTDRTEEICRRYASGDARLRFSRSEQRLSTAANFNRALHMASGECFMWAGHDDLREHTFISTLLTALQESPDAMLAFCRFDNIDAAGNVVRRVQGTWPRSINGRKLLDFGSFVLADESRTQKGNWTYGLMRRAALVACGGISEPRVDYSGEDIVTLVRLLSRGRFVHVDELLFHYRVKATVGPSRHAWLPYLRKRLIGTTPGHRGNLVLALVRNHFLHGGLRNVVWTESRFPWWQRVLLLAAIWAKEFTVLLRIATVRVIRELARTNVLLD